MEKLSLVVDGMGCGGCVANVRKVLDAMPGVAVENVAVGSAVVSFDPAQWSQETIAMALGKAGYPARQADPSGTPATAEAAGQGGHRGIQA